MDVLTAEDICFLAMALIKSENKGRRAKENPYIRRQKQCKRTIFLIGLSATSIIVDSCKEINQRQTFLIEFSDKLTSTKL